MEGVVLFVYENELEMLRDFNNILEILDPDIITGYNIIQFDLHFIVNRMKYKWQNENCNLGRLLKDQTTVVESKIQQKVMGYRQSYDINIPG